MLEKGTRDDAASRKTRSSAGLVPDIIGDARDEKRTELCRAWGKVRDKHCLFFFDDGAKANFISPELTAKLGIRPKKMGPACEANMTNPKLSTPVTPVIGKLWIHHSGL